MMIKKILTGEKGQGLTEYALILVLVAIVVMIILALLGPAIGNVFSNVVAAIGNPGGAKILAGVSAGGGLGTENVTVYVNETAFVSLSGDVSHSGKTCDPPSCHFTLSGPAHGTVRCQGDRQRSRRLGHGGRR